MKIIERRPPFEVRCTNCNSKYGVEEGDVTVLSQSPDAPTDVEWTCPVCDCQTSDWLTMLPNEWHKAILKRAGIEG